MASIRFALVMRTCGKAVIAGICLLGNSDANADLVLSYETASSTLNPALGAVVEDPGVVTGDNMTAGSGLNSAAGSTWTWSGWNNANSFDSAVDAGNFWSWGLDVRSDSNSFLDLTTLDIRLDRSIFFSGPIAFEIVASVNDGIPVSILQDDFLVFTGETYENVDLGELPTLQPGDSVEFRLAGWNALAGFGTMDLEALDSSGAGLRIFGDITAIPETGPMLMGTVACTLLGLTYLGRRNWQKQAIKAN